MKILLVNPSAYPEIGGVENSLNFIARELISRGHEVKIWCLQNSPNQALVSEHEGVQILRSPCPTIRWPHKRIRKTIRITQNVIPKLLETFPADAIWSRSARIAMGVAFSGFKGPLLQIFSTNAKMDSFGGFLQQKGFSLHRKVKYSLLFLLHFFSLHSLERDLLERCLPVCLSKNMANQLLLSYKKKASRAVVIPPGVDKSFFNLENGSKILPVIQKEYGLDFSNNYILYVGRLSAAKNIPLLMDAIALLPQASLLLVGDGKERKFLEHYAQRKKIASRTQFLGRQEELLPGFYKIAKVTVLPTTIESFGQVFLESLACGTPAVGFSADGKRVLTATDEIIKHGKTGLCVKETTPEALAAALKLIIEMPTEQYKNMQQNAIQDVINRFDWGRFVDVMLLLTSLESARNNAE